MKRVVSLSVVGLLLAGCATSKGAQEVDQKGTTAAGYYPLQIGNSWTFQVNYLGEVRTDTVTIEKEVDGFFVDSHEVKLATDAYGVRDEKRYLLREPVKAGTSWTNVVSVEAVEHYQVLSAGAACAVPAGNFPDCVVVESKARVPNGTLINEMTFAHGVGLVRVATVLDANGKRVPQIKLELTAWKLAAATVPAPAK